MSCPYHYAMNISVVRVPAYPQIQFIITLIIRSSMRKRNGIYYYVYPCVYRDKKLTYLCNVEKSVRAIYLSRGNY